MKAVGVIPEPEVKIFDLDDSDQFMIMASDGVWEFITSQVCHVCVIEGLTCPLHVRGGSIWLPADISEEVCTWTTPTMLCIPPIVHALRLCILIHALTRTAALPPIYLQEAVDIVQRNLHLGYHLACQELIETAAARWQDEEGDYRDDVSVHRYAVCLSAMRWCCCSKVSLDTIRSV